MKQLAVGGGALALMLGLFHGAALAADAATPGAAVQEEQKPAIVISGGAALTTDYVFRGISQTFSGPAVQGYIEASYNILYLGAWGSNIDFGAAGGRTIADLEVDFYGGVRPKWNSVEFDVGFIYYMYPDAFDPAGEFNYLEFKGAFSVPVHEMVSLGGAIYYSPDFFGSVGDAVYVESSGSLTLPYGFALSAALGYQWFDNAALIDYVTWNIGASWTYRDTLTFDVRYHDTDLSVAQCGSNNCKSRIVGSVKVDFSTD